MNWGYAFSVSASIADVLVELREALEQNGFTRAEAERILVPTQATLPFGTQPRTIRVEPDQVDTDAAQINAAALDGKAKIDAATGEITIFVSLDARETAALASCVKTPEAKAQVEETIVLVRAWEQAFGGRGESRKLSPYEQQMDFVVPLLCVREEDRLFEFEETFLIDRSWKLSEKDAALSVSYDPRVRPVGYAGVVDVGAQGDLETSVVRQMPGSDFISLLHQQVLDFGGSDEWTVERLVAWLDRRIEHEGITIGESAVFLRKAVRGVMARCGIEDIGVLALDRFRLRDEIARRIQEHRQAERQTAFQTWLFPESPLAVGPEYAINFKTMSYEPSRWYDGDFQFQKHYFGPKPGELPAKTPNGSLTEECRCAQFLDGLAEVKFWIRNLPKKPTSFSLQTSTDRFYPDFLCRLADDRVLVVEYKGEHLYDAADAEEKRAVGKVWESRSSGRCLFVMPTGLDFSEILKAVRSV